MVALYAYAVAWLKADPWFTALVLWPVVSALFTGVFRHRTPEELARLPLPLQYLVRGVAYVGFDSASLLAMLRGKMFPTAGPPSPPSSTGPAGTLMIFALGCFAVLTAITFATACGAVTATQAQKDGAGLGYRADLIACDVDAGTREAADACRHAVNARYGVDAGNYNGEIVK